jgi:hypothetical protein
MPFDKIVAGQIGIGDVHHQGHNSNLWIAGHYDSVVGSNVSVDVLLKTPAAWSAHMTAEGAAGGDAVGYLFEGTSVSSDGTALTVVCTNREDPKTAKVTAFHTPTVTGNGMLVMAKFMPGGNWWFSPGGQSSTGAEIILKQSTNYLLRVTNISGGSVPISAGANWYEIPVIPPA